MAIEKDKSELDADNEIQIVELHKPVVDLYKILKFEGLVGSGGEAKSVIANGHVKVNGVVETQKRKKIVAGDTISFSGVRIRLKFSATKIQALQEPQEPEEPQEPQDSISSGELKSALKEPENTAPPFEDMQEAADSNGARKKEDSVNVRGKKGENISKNLKHKEVKKKSPRKPIRLRKSIKKK